MRHRDVHPLLPKADPHEGGRHMSAERPRGGGAWLAVWIALNVGLTLLNKAVFSFGSFHFPLTLSAIHMLLTGILSWVCVHQLQLFPHKKLDLRGELFLVFFSVIFSANIVLGNISIEVVSVPLVQVFRAIIPGVTMALAYAILGKHASFGRIVSMVPVCFGVMLTVSGDLDLTFLGYIGHGSTALLSSRAKTRRAEGGHC